MKIILLLTMILFSGCTHYGDAYRYMKPNNTVAKYKTQERICMLESQSNVTVDASMSLIYMKMDKIYSQCMIDAGYKYGKAR